MQTPLDVRVAHPEVGGPIVTLALLLLPTAGAVGSLAYLGSPEVSLYRIMIVGLAVIGLLLPHDKKRKPFTEIPGLIPLLSIWTVLALGLTPFVPDASLKISELTNLFLGFVALLTLVKLVNTPRLLHIFCRGWLAAYVIVLAAGYWELRTGSHFSNYAINGQLLSADYSPPAGTLGNPNNLALFLVMSWVLVDAWAKKSNKPRNAALAYVLVLSSLPLLLQTGSRITLAIFAILLMLRLAFLIRRKARQLVLGLGVFTVCLLGVFPEILSTAYGAISPGALSGPGAWLSEVGQSGTSGGVRLNLSLNGMYLTWITWCVGSGPGGFRWASSQGEVPFPTWQIIDPHNLWVEISSQYGIVVLALFIYVLIRLLLCGIKNRGSQCVTTRTYSHALVLAISVLPLGALVSSSSLKLPIFWLFLSFCCAAFLMVKRTANSGDQNLDPDPQLNHGDVFAIRTREARSTLDYAYVPGVRDGL